MRAYLQKNPIPRLNIGAGYYHLPGWLNTDCVPTSRECIFLDATKPFPLSNGAFAYIFCEHMIEHIPYRAGCDMLRECFRVLKDWGRIRIATPDLAVLLGLFTTPRTAFQERYIQYIQDTFLPSIKVYNPIFVINNAFRNWGHQFLYNEETLRAALQEAGFADIVRWAPGESGDAVLRDLEGHGIGAQAPDIYCFETMVLEARRPPDAARR
jgi:predicted SAM-dependent methyltransferase